MNGEDLPLLNGFPLRLVVPGYYGTYWVKHLNEITVLDKPFDGFWMNTAYRIPDNACACTEPGNAPKTTVPIGRYNVRSFLTNLADGAKVKAGRDARSAASPSTAARASRRSRSRMDGGKTWTGAQLGRILARYSFRPWTLPVNFAAGAHDIQVRATGNDRRSPADGAALEPAGYMRNVVETTRVQAA